MASIEMTSCFFRKLLFKRLQKLRHGLLTLEDSDGQVHVFGTDSSHSARITVRDPRFYRRVMLGGSLALGESYVDGWWDPQDGSLVELFQLIFRSRIYERARGSIIARGLAALHAYLNAPRSPYIARRDIHVHYDLGNEFFKHMLDESLTYSCGYQRGESDTLSDMQRFKCQRIAQKLELSSASNLLDVGCGFGAMLLYAGEHFPKLRGLGITLSDEQYKLANQRLQQAGLQDRFRVELRDYRELSGQYDRIVSIGMFEHVGRDSYPAFFSKVRSVLHSRGLGLLHTIALEEPPNQRQDPWIDRYIFPGTYLPRLEQIASSMRESDLAIGHIENWRPHYAITLRHWRNNFVRNWPYVQNLDPKFNQHFFRLWNYYLQLCEACFIDSTIELYQVLFCPRDSWGFTKNFYYC